jgi:hypothetical protein
MKGASYLLCHPNASTNRDSRWLAIATIRVSVEYRTAEACLKIGTRQVTYIAAHYLL